MSSRWHFGDHVVLRGVWRGRLWWAAPVTVVRDDPDATVLYWPAGTPDKMPERRLAPKDLLSAEQVALFDRHWVDTDVLMLTTPGAAHSVYAMWEMGHTRLRCWYIDLQEPLRRTPLGFDTMDHLLDIVVTPDRCEWRWKDEDELSEAVAIGLYSAAEASAIRVEGERAIGLLQAGTPPYEHSWATWSPPAEWGIPSLPEDWQSKTSGDEG